MMQRREFIRGAACAPFLGGAAAAKAQTPTLVAHGGGDLNSGFFADLRNAAGRKDFRLLLSPYSSRNPSKKAAQEIKKLRGLGYSNVDVLNLRSLGAARDQIEAADLVWFSGGSQRRQVETIWNMPGFRLELQRGFANGVVMSGVGGGAAALSRLMIIGGKKKGNVETGTGLGIWNRVVLDQQVDTRARQFRLREVISANRRLIGLGLDEGTWVTYSNGIATVNGSGKARLVYWSSGLKELEYRRNTRLKLPA